MIYFLGEKPQQLFESESKVVYITEKEMVDVMTEMLKGDYINYDLETSGLDPHSEIILLVAFGTEKDQLIIPGNRVKEIKSILNVLEEFNVTLIAHNAKFDWKFTKKHFEVDVPIVCTMLAHQIVYCGLDKSSSLEDLYLQFYGKYIDKTVRRKFIGKRTYSFSESEICYAAEDVTQLTDMYEKLLKALTKYNLLEVNKLEQGCLKVYGEIELNGMYLDKEYWQTEVIDYYTEVQQRTKRYLENLLIAKAPEYENRNKSTNLFTGEVEYFKVSRKKPMPGERCSINWNSGQQIYNLLKEKYGIDLAEYKEKDLALTGTENIIRFCNPEFQDEAKKGDLDTLIIYTESNGGNLIEYLYIYNKVSSLLSKFGQALMDHINPVTGRIHTHFFQIKDTGRVSCNDPNLQQIRAEKRFRAGFRVRSEDYSILCQDFSGAELRIIADGSGDPTMIEAFKNNEDVHSKMATIMFGVPVSKKENPNLRVKTKTIVFGLAYGAGANKFAPAFGGNINEAKAAVNKFFSSFPQIKRFLEGYSNTAKQHCYSTTFAPYNRIRWYEKPDPLDSEEEKKRRYSSIERMGKNHPIQGTCADIVKKATLDILSFLFAAKLDAYLIHQVHDEIVIEFNHTKIDPVWFQSKIKEIMLNAGASVIKSILMEVEGSIADCWQK